MKTMLIGFILFPFALLGQVRQVTLDEATRLALENNTLLHISRTKTESAEARRNEVRTTRLPSLKFQAGYTRLSDIDPFAVRVPFSPTPITLSPIVLNNYAMRLSLQQPLFTGFRLENALRAVSHLAEAAEQDYSNDQASVVYATAAGYWNLVKAMEYKQVVTENVAQIKAHVRDVEHFMKQGLATQSDLLKVQVQLSNSQLLEIDAENNVKVAMMMLNNIMGQPVETQIHPESMIEVAPESEGLQLEELVRRAMENRSDLAAMRLRVQAGEASVEASRGAWYPQVYLTGSYYYARPNPRILPTKDEFNDTWDVGIGISFDVWNWMATSYQTTQATASLTETRYTLKQLADGITLEVTQHHLDVVKAREKLSVAAQAVENAQENFRITKAKFATGMATNTELLDSEVELLQAKTNHLVVRINYELAKAKLKRSVAE